MSSTVAARIPTAYENTTNQIYADYLEKNKSLDFSSIDMRVLNYPASRIMQLGLHYTPEECHLISRFERRDVLDYEIAAERKREQARHVGSNVISEAVIEKIRERMDNYTTNSAVSFLVFASKSLELFSGGLFTGLSFFTLFNYAFIFVFILLLF
jgi:hypothetical protein